MNEKSPLISIVMPVYNRETYIGKTLDSLIQQEYDNWEVVIVDDSSTDKTCNIIKKYKDIDERIRLLKKSSSVRSGAPAGRNLGIRMSI